MGDAVCEREEEKKEMFTLVGVGCERPWMDQWHSSLQKAFRGEGGYEREGGAY